MSRISVRLLFPHMLASGVRADLTVFLVSAVSRLKLVNKFNPLTIHSLTCIVVSSESEVEENTARPVYPFTAIIGQEEMKFAALMNIIDPNMEASW